MIGARIGNPCLAGLKQSQRCSNSPTGRPSLAAGEPDSIKVQRVSTDDSLMTTRSVTASDVHDDIHRPLVDPALRVIAPAKRRLRLRDLPRSVDVIRVLASRDFKVKYKQTIFGPLWVVFQPIALLAAFLVAFDGLGHVNTGHVPYVVFALVGLSSWSYVQSTLTICAASMISNLPFVKYTPMPRIAMLCSGIISSLPTFAVTAFAALVAAAVTGTLSPRFLLMPAALVWLLVLTAGMSAILAAYAARYRDVLSLLPFLLQLGSFVSPVGYDLNQLSPTLRTVIELNPITGQVEVLRWMFLSGYSVGFEPIVISVALTVALAVAGWRVFSRRETTLADEI